MFAITKNLRNQTDRIDTLIGPFTNITGNITSTGVIRIDGKYTGDILSESDVIIGEGAYINGNITAANVSISGKVDGDIKSSGNLEIFSAGSVIGDIEVANFSIAKGANFNGKCIMLSNEAKKFSAVNE